MTENETTAPIIHAMPRHCAAELSSDVVAPDGFIGSGA
jgi:hypothetical protein